MRFYYIWRSVFKVIKFKALFCSITNLKINQKKPVDNATGFFVLDI